MIASLSPFDPELGPADSVFNRVQLSVRVTPAKRAARGGDWCETFALSKDVIALSIGDVCGHGVEAFPMMHLVRQAVRDAALRGFDPAQTLAAANRAICMLDPWFYATAIFALLDTRRRLLTFANAGHPPPLMIGPGSARFLTYPAADLPLGIRKVSIRTSRVVNTPASALLVLYTDGVTEYERRPLLGETQLFDAARSAYACSAPATALAIEELMSLPAYNHDDVSILTASLPGVNLSPHLAWPHRLSHAARS